MTFLRGVSERFWDYVSPRKTQQKRDKPFKVPAVPIRNVLQKQQAAIPPKKLVAKPLERRVSTPESRDMSPESRVHNWDVPAPGPSSDTDIDHAQLPPSPPTSAKEFEEYDLEGDTLVGDASPNRKDSTTTKTGSSGDQMNANGDTTVVDDGSYLGIKIDVEEERRRREQQGRELLAAGWSEDGVFLFQKLGMRGFEPILPFEWLDDLETLPADLFTAREDKVFLRPVDPTWSASYLAQQALSKLFDLGGRIRDSIKTEAVQRKPHVHTKRAIKKYTKWAMRDGKVEHLWKQLPLFKTVVWDAKVHANIGEREMINKLLKLYDQWYVALGIDEAEERGDKDIPEVPTLYGVTASHGVLAFVSLQLPMEEKEMPKLRLIALFNFQKEGFDVWHSLAIAIFVTHCRNRMIELREHLPAPDIPSSSDPDA